MSTLVTDGSPAMPLPAGLLALSEELPSVGLRQALRRVAGYIERGTTIDEILENPRKYRVPATLVGLLEASRHADQLSLAFERYVDCIRESFETRRQLRASFAYIAFLMFSGFSVSTLYLLVVGSRNYLNILEGFEINIPIPTYIVVNLGQLLWKFGLPVFGIGTLAVLALWMVTGWIGRGSVRQGVLDRIPVIGKVFRFSSLAQFCYLLSVLIEARLPLPRALRIAGEGAGSATLRRSGDQMAKSVEAGTAPYDAALEAPHIPLLLASLFRWISREDVLPEALRATGDLFAAESRAQARLLVLIFEPFFILLVALTAVAVTAAAILPLFQLLGYLMG